ncbi:hypothetical protein EV715DRAFT_297327 [Schizophyllum commune]
MALRLHAGISFCVSISPYKITLAYADSPPYSTGRMLGLFKNIAMGQMETEPDVTVIRVLLDNCLPHTAEFGFFLSTSRFELDGFV